MKTLFQNGKIYDGTGAEPFVGSVLIEDDRVVAVGPDVDAEADKVVDLAGKSIAPGSSTSTPTTTGSPSRRTRSPTSSRSSARA